MEVERRTGFADPQANLGAIQVPAADYTLDAKERVRDRWGGYDEP